MVQGAADALDVAAGEAGGRGRRKGLGVVLGSWQEGVLQGHFRLLKIDL